ncbi:hypothetical protein A2331_02060 [Candidatus Falkowbacteria bacterium RIFOXYB2_FULL_34_18]|uniref:DUF4870 domain-containing protein n=1 Tax=Candidatus Falkowbacteria bacterium RIFOXYD2_FULL_34_120 TaxID=1798007 RepID=A0A1F5TQZ8_9BACT|nr:MAG: hypothetical protein A2331_02060 [Candidatus Falkowbacteria bacterium RIFOXYB2_FULL_34_18]OGF29465.1 MAG: hypothetical protein A2500_01120 [Candidatus Falkowbacteria bacterium RIFOXYC12_FULL_34_55]OGF36778.1 MAG: hypothetical protein A2466_03430 [Candidatus Falkowbacteria bacterium RIFOXYC2_FULL_34_220]OGF38991.1 MAG: hypothetical protein A2515_05545 [Candidatus Falkowbacteria bacterium RIFOXYD12_FULL_34_57]OGF41184.1 MAG: hypothetical protein A2531_01550 [Candidatus Falkowbacteria bact
MPKEKKSTKIVDIKEQDVEENKTVAALSYAWILCLVPLLGKRNSKFAQFHAKQGLVLFAIELGASLVVWFPFFGQLLMLMLTVVAVMGIIKALNGEWWKIPYIYEWSKKINL